jgi:hypothetical protein
MYRSHRPGCATNKIRNCAGKGCVKEGKIALRIKYLRKIGYFCDACTAELMQHGLASRESGVLKI